MKLNEELKKSTAIYIVICFTLVFLSLILYIFLISPLRKKKVELKQLYDYEISLNKKIDEPNSKNTNFIEINKLYDNNRYDEFYKSLINITENYGFEYMSLSNYYTESVGDQFYPMLTDVKINLGAINNIHLLSNTLNNKLVDFEFNLDDVSLKFKNLFIFDNSYSQKDIEIDNRKLDEIENIESETVDELIDEGNSEDKNLYNVNTNLNTNEDMILKNQIFNFSQKIERIGFIPMNENLILDFKKQVSPVINVDSLMLNVINNSDNDGVCLMDLSKLKFKLYSGDLDIYVNEYLFGDSMDTYLYCKDINGTYYDIKGFHKNQKTLFNIDDNLQFPIEIVGIKYRINPSQSLTISLVELGYEIKNSKYDDFIKNGKFSTILKYRDIGMDDFLYEIGGSVNKDEFIKDNSLTEEKYKNAKILLVRFRELYEIE